MQTVIPMRGRMIHDVHGKLDSQFYDMDGQVRLSPILWFGLLCAMGDNYLGTADHYLVSVH